MSLFPQRFIEDLRLQANIVQVVQEYVPLKRVGRTFKGLCPFHSEKSPSFHVDQDKGFFHCFGCHAGGDVFKFLELHEKVSFPDAVKMLAQKFGVALPEPENGADADASRRDTALRESLLKVHEVAAEYFREQLANPVGARARQQLKDRDVTQPTIDQLGLGYAPRDGLKARLLGQGFPQGLLLQSGLLVQRDTGEIVDRFRNRLMVPIYRDTGSVIAFGGRQMDPEQGGPKYLNSPETPIYSKSRTLYGLSLSKQDIRKVGYAVLVEGYFDFAQMLQSQAAPAVASCGTALTVQQAQLLRRFTSKVVLSFDRDTAGMEAATRSSTVLVKEGFDVNVLIVDKGEDPDTFIRKQGAQKYRERLKASRPYLEYVPKHAASAFDLRSAGGRGEYLAKMKEFADGLREETQRGLFAEHVASFMGVTDTEVLAQFRRSFRTQGAVASTIVPRVDGLKPAEKALIWALFHETPGALAALERLDPDDLDGLAGREIIELAQQVHAEEGKLLPSTLLQRLSTVDAQLVTGIAAAPASQAPAAACVQEFKRLRWERERAAIQREIDRLQKLGASQHEREIDDLWQRKKNLIHRIEQLT